MGADQKPRYNHILDLVKISEELSAQASDGRLQICRRQWLTCLYRKSDIMRIFRTSSFDELLRSQL